MCDLHDPKGKKSCFDHVDSGLDRVGIHCVVNDENYCRQIDPTMTLLQFLNTELKLFGTKEGCGEGECGACTIIMNDKPVNSCLVLAVEANGATIRTVEGLAKQSEISILQQTFIEYDALQCGFCTPGMLMSCRALLDREPSPSEAQIREAIAGNFCRCTGYVPIINAVLAAADREREALLHDK